jgi:metal-responsive CopG/Arc/MetJ family transcriptional regulator
MHIELDDAIVGDIDAIAGPRRRSAFVREAIIQAADRHRRMKHLRAAAGVLSDSEHEWDDDPAEWVSRQRTGDPRRVG